MEEIGTRYIKMKIKCTCENKYQDKKYDGKRIANKTNKVIGNKEVYRCTVCNKESTETI